MAGKTCGLKWLEVAMRSILVGAGVSAALIWGAAGVSEAAPRARPAVVGEAKMLPDGSLSVKLRPEGAPPGGQTRTVVFKPENPRYKEILAHVGDMKPGERKPLAPWPNRPPQ
jgi:multidrug efflux pump subunit AcrA (membrane-fusion protein)